MSSQFNRDQHPALESLADGLVLPSEFLASLDRAFSNSFAEPDHEYCPKPAVLPRTDSAK